MAISGYIHLSPAGAGLKNGADWNNAHDLASLLAAGAPAAGRVLFVKEGTYTLTANIDWSATAGTSVNPIMVLGVKSGTTNVGASVVYSDWAVLSTNFPFVDMVTYSWRFGVLTRTEGIFFQGSATYAVQTGNNATVKNCKFDNDNAASTSNYILFPNANSAVVYCEFLSAKGRGLNSTMGANFIAYNYFHDFADATNGVAVGAGAYDTIINNIFDNCQNAAIICGAYLVRIVNNTFYETDVAVTATNSYDIQVLNNVCEGNDVAGFKWTTQIDSNLFWGNHGDDARCTDMWVLVDVATVFQDYEVTAGDPLFTAAGTDFSIGKTSPCRGTAEDLYLSVGATVKHGNKGAWQGFTTANILPAAAKVNPDQLTFGESGEVTASQDLPALTSVWDGDSLEGVPGTFPEAARNTITDPNVVNGFPYIRLGTAAIGSAAAGGPGASRGSFHIGL